MAKTMYPIDTKVLLVNHTRADEPKVGKVRGHGFISDEFTTRPVYLVELDQGFYNPEKNIYVSTLVCDSDALEALIV